MKVIFTQLIRAAAVAIFSGSLLMGSRSVLAEDPKPALPPGHPTVPAKPNNGPQLPVGHPQLPAGHPQDPAATTEPEGATLELRIIQGTAGAKPITSGTPTLELRDGDKVFAAMPTPLESDGHVHIYDVPMQKPFVPALKWTYAGVKYEVIGKPISIHNLTQDLNLTVYETTNQPPDWKVKMRHVLIKPDPIGLAVSEVFVIENPSNKTYVPDANGNALPVFAWPIPQGAKQVTLHGGFQSDSLKLDSGKLINPTAMSGGLSQYEISYVIPSVDGGTKISFESVAATKSVTIFLQSIKGKVDVDGLTESADPEMGDETQVRMLKASDVAAGINLQIKFVELASPATKPSIAPGIKSETKSQNITPPTAESVVATIWSDPKNRIIMGFIGVIVFSLISLYKAARRTSNPGRARPSCPF